MSIYFSCSSQILQKRNFPGRNEWSLKGYNQVAYPEGSQVGKQISDLVTII
jgi:hypothetical protein